MIVISNQEILIFRFNIFTIHQHWNYFLCSKISSKNHLSILHINFSFLSQWYSQYRIRKSINVTSKFSKFINFISIFESHFLFENQFRILCVRFINQCFFFIHSMNSISRQKSTTHWINEFRIFNQRFVKRFNTKIIYFFREHCQVIFVFFIDWSYFLISTIISISIKKIVQIFINI